MTTPAPDLAAEVERIRHSHRSTVIQGWGGEDVDTLLRHIDQQAAELQYLRDENYSMSQDDGKLEREVERLQARIRELEQPRPAAGVDERLTERLKMACIAACSCLTKTPDWQHHETNCRYRLFQESIAALDRSAQECAELKKELHDLRCPPDADGDQHACNVCGFAIRYGERHGRCGRYVMALEARHAQECAGLRDQLEGLNTVIVQLEEVIRIKERNEDCLAEDCKLLRARLASHDACLAQVREEMPEVERARAYLDGGHFGPGFEAAQIAELLKAIDKLQSHEAANRNAIKTAQETIAARDYTISLRNGALSALREAWIRERAEAEARERGLREQLSILTAERDSLSDKLDRKNQDIDCMGLTNAALQSQLASHCALREALQALYSETVDYITVNNLGPVHWNRSMQMARDALAAQPAAVQPMTDQEAKLLSGVLDDLTQILSQPAAVGQQK